MEISKPSIVSIASLRLKQLLETMIVQMKSDGTSITSYEGLSNRGDGDGDGGSVGRSINNHIYLAVTDGPHPTYFTSVNMRMMMEMMMMMKTMMMMMMMMMMIMMIMMIMMMVMGNPI